MVAAACGNQTARAPNPTAYDWPDSFAFRVHEVAQTERDTQAVARYETWRVLRGVIGYDGAFAVSQDSVRIGSGLEGEALHPVPPLPEDTLRYFVRLSRWGEFLSEEPACDPAVSECRDARPSSLLMELRRISPRLPVWWPPKGGPWEDTLPIDDSPRLRALRGVLVTEYRAPRDTVVGGRACWIVTWRATWRSAHPEVVAGITYGVATESAVVYVDKQRQIPALAVWHGTYPPPPESLARGATRTEVRGSAVLVGSVFDAPVFTQEAR